MESLAEFLNKHPKEFVILDFQHFYDFSKIHHDLLTNYLMKTFSVKIYERFQNEEEFPYLTLSNAFMQNKQIIIIYRNSLNISPSFFQSYYFSNSWPNVTNTLKLEEFLNNNLQSRMPYQGFCSQLVLTPTSSFIVPRFYSSLRNKCAKKVHDKCEEWIKSQTPGKFNDNEARRSNVFLLDFVDLDDNALVKIIIDLNLKLMSSNEIL